MRHYLSIDIETSGLESERCQIFSLGAVLGDFGEQPVKELPSFYREVYHQQVIGEPIALVMNKDILDRMGRVDMNSSQGVFVWPDMLWSEFWNWMRELDVLKVVGSRKITVTGKNFGSFDSRFLEKIQGWNPELFHHRILDPGSLYFQPLVDNSLPSLSDCMKRAGLQGIVAHNALEDAQLVVELIRSYYRQDRLRLAYAHSIEAFGKTETNLRLEKM